MRYNVISTENTNGLRWADATTASFRHGFDAVEFCKSLDIPAYVVDSFHNFTLYKNPLTGRQL